MKDKTKNIIGGVIILIVVFAAYSFFFVKDEDSALLVSQSAGGARGESEIVQEFLVLLHTLGNIKLDTDIFENPIFNSLRDESVELFDEPQGRENPFAPL
ncbi:hypothetical protein CL630_00755 [bacterium]|nr:hypothetical protein [bacterium]